MIPTIAKNIYFSELQNLFTKNLKFVSGGMFVMWVTWVTCGGVLVGSVVVVVVVRDGPLSAEELM